MLGKVLIIDDEINLRETLTRILRRVGCEVSTAEEGKKALQLIENGTFDLVYLDIHLPQLDGLQILKEIRQQDTQLPVILLTGYGSLQSAMEAVRLGATDYLLKPYDPEVLVARTRIILKEQALERRKQDIREKIERLQAELQSLEVEKSEPALPIDLSSSSQERFLKQGALILDLQARQATLGDEVLSLPPAAFDYLAVLAKHSPEVVDYETLVSEAQNYQVSASEARELAKWHIHVLRQAIEKNPQTPKYIYNIRSIGYRLLVD
jgi:DNA-binding response OmpR family regulator